MTDTKFIFGRDLNGHPCADPRPYRKTGTVLAAQASNPGVIGTPEGDMAYSIGDYIVTDDPPTHAWPVKREVFEATYAEIEEEP